MQTIRQMIVPDEDVGGIIQGLEETPDNIRELQEKLVDLKLARKMDTTVKGIQAEVDALRDGLKFEIQEETVQAPDTRKPGKADQEDTIIPGKITKKYPNAEARAAALAKAEREDKSLQATLHGLQAAINEGYEADANIEKIEIGLKAQQNYHKSFLAVAAIISGLSHEDTSLKRLDFLNEENARLSQKIGLIKDTIEKLENE